MKNLLTSFLLIVSLIITVGCGGTKIANTPIPPSATAKAEASAAMAEIGQLAPNFTYTDLATGKQMQLADLRGKPVYLNFWATWCPLCINEMLHIQDKYVQYKDKMQVLAISVDDEKNSPAKFMQNKGYTFSAGYGNVNEVSQKYQLQAIPASYIIDANGVIKAKMIGGMNAAAMEVFFQKGL